MFIRPCWRPGSPQEALDLLEQNSRALLVGNGVEVPFATNLPLVRDREADSPDLVGQMVHGNDHAGAIESRGAQVLAVFEDFWSYVSAGLHPDRDMPSTYCYTAVHRTRTLKFQDEVALDKPLEDLLEPMRARYPTGWRTSEIPGTETTRRFAAIAGFRIQVKQIETRFEPGQDEPHRGARAVAETHGKAGICAGPGTRRADSQTQPRPLLVERHTDGPRRLRSRMLKARLAGS